MGSKVSKKFRRQVERVSQDRINGPIVLAFRKKFAPLMRIAQEVVTGCVLRKRQ
jgi:hypothetical protein